ncbi:MAG: LysM peptidoglycan-binding domain-containing protein [Chloroflexi bacterium]|nr:MAG: LysM peptidoglycan-binding domain-containing protein [Chloroflexota bacterium]
MSRDNVRRKRSRARDRQMARKRKQAEQMASIEEPVVAHERVVTAARVYDGSTPSLATRASLALQDAVWYARTHPLVWKASGGVLILLFAFLYLTPAISGRILPNVSAAGIPLGGMTVEEAETVLLDAWVNEMQIELTDGERTWLVSPVELGLRLDAHGTADAANGFKLSAIPFGTSVEPVVEVDLDRAQSYLLDLADEASFPAVNAGYEWDGDTLIGVPGRTGRVLDVADTVDVLLNDPAEIANRGRLLLQMDALQPQTFDPSPYLEQAREFVSQGLVLNGYDPFKDEFVTWTADENTLSSWLEAGVDGLTFRRETFLPFLQEQNLALSNVNEQRFLEPSETLEKMQQALNTMQNEVDLRIRYRASTYTVEAGDTAFGIGRKTGVPVFLIQEANPGLDLNILSPGDVLNLPSRDVMAPLDPVPNKRIIVDLPNQRLEAYENGEVVFHWQISSGIASAPTSPGIYQILSHEEVAYGSSFSLCDEAGCGQWEMEYFMGLYEVTPGLMNGFHGAVGLPDGTYLGGNQVGRPYTFGCVMSRKDQAELLYNWADEGTIVEIISHEFAPESTIGQNAFSQPV